MSAVELRSIVAGYGSLGVLDGVDLSVAEGTTTAVLGGSGSGKTTLLRVIAGFLRPQVGTVQIGGRTVVGQGEWVAPERRGIGYVRQDGGLFPHLDVAGNIAFGLPRRQRRQRDQVLELLDLVDLPESVADRRPDQLSGGQQQRVALARALAPKPDLVLLDEPFSSLDTTLREATREATARALHAAEATAILVTHDQGEALSFADEVAVLRDGHFRQVAAPREIYGAPIDPHVAAFLGDAVIVPGEAAEGHVECALGSLSVAGFVPYGAVDVMVRPEQILLSPHGDAPVKAMVTSVAYFGHDALVQLELQAVHGVVATPAADRALRARIVGLQPPEVGEIVGLSVVGPVRVFSRSAGHSTVAPD